MSHFDGFQPLNISTHALREEGDRIPAAIGVNTGAISTHALREEGDWQRATRSPLLKYFYPRPPRGGRRKWPWIIGPAIPFLPTPSARRATYCPACRPVMEAISTHALREEGDPFRTKFYFTTR